MMGLEELIEKYRHDKLNPEELKELKQRINSLSDAELMTYLNFDDKEASYDIDKSVEKIRRNIESRIGGTKTAQPHYFTVILKYAAVIIAFICLAGLGLILFYGTDSPVEKPLSYNILYTQAGNEPRLILSDNTEIKMLPNSTLKYPSEFQGNTRTVEFSGIGFFEVAKNAEKPFIVELQGLEVIVKGTSFSIDAREESDYTQIILLEGAVNLISTISDEKISLSPDSVATLNNITGEITVSPINPNCLVDWDNEEIKFSNITPDSLIMNIERYYAVQLPGVLKKSINCNFSGTLPINDLNTTLKVLEGIYCQ